jgi:hypothetical protein
MLSPAEIRTEKPGRALIEQASAPAGKHEEVGCGR